MGVYRDGTPTATTLWFTGHSYAIPFGVRMEAGQASKDRMELAYAIGFTLG